MEMHLFGLGWVFNWGGWAAVVVWWMLWGVAMSVLMDHLDQTAFNWLDAAVVLFGILFWLCNGGVSARYEMSESGWLTVLASVFVVLLCLDVCVSIGPTNLKKGSVKTHSLVWAGFSTVFCLLTVATLFAGLHNRTCPLLSSHDKLVLRLNNCAHSSATPEDISEPPALHAPYHIAICAAKAGNKEALEVFLDQAPNAPLEQLGRVALLTLDLSPYTHPNRTLHPALSPRYAAISTCRFHSPQAIRIILSSSFGSLFLQISAYALNLLMPAMACSTTTLNDEMILFSSFSA